MSTQQVWNLRYATPLSATPSQVSASTPQLVYTNRNDLLANWYRMDGSVGGGGVGNFVVLADPPSGSVTNTAVMGRFISGPLVAQTIPSGTWTFYAVMENAGNLTSFVLWGAALAVYRPSSGAIVGRIFDLPLGGTSEPAFAWFSHSQTFSGASLTIQNGDVLVFEVWSQLTMSHQPANGEADLFFNGGTVYADGGGNPALSNPLSSLTAPAALVTNPTTLNLGTLAATGTTTAVLILSAQQVLAFMQPLWARGIGLAGCLLVSEPPAASQGTSQAFPSLTVLIDWTNSGSYVDESANVRAVRITRGRAQVTDQFAAGQCDIRLKNEAGRYSPFNAAGALFPNVAAGRPVTVTAAYHGVSYPLFAGYTSDFGQTTKFPTPEVSPVCLDAFEHFRLLVARADVQRSQAVSDWINHILDAAAWPAAARAIDPAGVLPLAVSTQTTILAALQEAAGNEPGGLLFVDASGNVVFHARDRRPATPILASLSAVEDMSLAVRASDAVSSVAMSYNGYVWATSQSTVYAATYSTPLPLPPGDTTISGVYSSVAAQTQVQPLGGTDYFAVQNADGSGADRTSQVSVAAWSPGGVSFSLTLHNAGSATVYLTSLAVRGVALTPQTNAPGFTVTVTAPAPVVAGQQLSQTFAFQQSRGDLYAWAQQRANAMSQSQPRPQVQIAGKSTALTHLLLAAQPGSRILLSDQAGPWLSGIAGQFFIEQIDLEIAPGTVPTATWQLFSQDQAVPPGSQFPPQTGRLALRGGLPWQT